jgi:hypothetical protein
MKNYILKKDRTTFLQAFNEETMEFMWTHDKDSAQRVTYEDAISIGFMVGTYLGFSTYIESV